VYELLGHQVDRSKRQYGRPGGATKKDKVKVFIENQEREITEF